MTTASILSRLSDLSPIRSLEEDPEYRSAPLGGVASALFGRHLENLIFNRNNLG